MVEAAIVGAPGVTKFSAGAVKTKVSINNPGAPEFIPVFVYSSAKKSPVAGGEKYVKAATVRKSTCPDPVAVNLSDNDKFAGLFGGVPPVTACPAFGLYP